jgi:hypothetical protein
MSISPFSARPASPEGESRRTRLALIAATVGIAATLVAYAVSPGVRHAVGHAAHNVKHAVSRVLDHDSDKAHRKRPTPAAHGKRPVRPVHSAAPAVGANTTNGSRISTGSTTSSR